MFELTLDYSNDARTNNGVSFVFFFFKGGIGSCCRKVTETQISRDLLKSYYVQRTPSCPIVAVV